MYKFDCFYEVESVSKISGREKGIRTPGGFHLNGFQDRRFRPLSHLPSEVNLSYSVALCIFSFDHW